MVELAKNGKITDLASFESQWGKCIDAHETEMLAIPNARHFLPLSQSVSLYEVEKLKCWRHILLTMLLHAKAGAANVGSKSCPAAGDSEVGVRSKDGLFFGKIDAVEEAEHGIEIVDFKTGEIYEPGGQEEIKSEYVEQLKLYAFLFNETFQKWPVALAIARVGGKKVLIHFAVSECLEAAEAARQLVGTANNIITNSALHYRQKIQSLASPSPKNCAYCPYRPICTPYWEKRAKQEEIGWPRDAQGTLIELKKLGNGLLMARIDPGDQGSGEIVIRGLHQERHPALAEASGKIAFISLLNDSVENKYCEGDYTAAFRYYPSMTSLRNFRNGSQQQ